MLAPCFLTQAAACIDPLQRYSLSRWRVPLPLWHSKCIQGILVVRRRLSGIASAAPGEVRLPQGLRFTDVRRSTIRGIGVASSGSRTPKSSGCTKLCPPSSFLPPLRFPPAAPFLRANLRCLLDRNSCPVRRLVHPLWRYPRSGFSASNFSVRGRLPYLPYGSAAL